MAALRVARRVACHCGRRNQLLLLLSCSCCGGGGCSSGGRRRTAAALLKCLAVNNVVEHFAKSLIVCFVRRRYFPPIIRTNTHRKVSERRREEQTLECLAIVFERPQLTVAISIGAIYNCQLHQLPLLELVLSVHLSASNSVSRLTLTAQIKVDNEQFQKILTIGTSSCLTSSRARFSFTCARF